MNTTTLETLEELRDAMIDRHPAIMDREGHGWSTELPVFGGPDPGDTSGVWSWDKDSLLIGSCASDLEIVDRP